MISNRFESLAQAFRIFSEQYIRFRPLFLEDAPEAVGNLDHGAESMLNAFHGLYDAARAHVDFDFYGDGFYALTLRIRNARHHNQANGIRSIYNCARLEPHPKNYLLVNWPSTNEGGNFATYYVSWSDVTAVLNEYAPRFPESVGQSLEAIEAPVLEEWYNAHGYDESAVFINLIPILMGAGNSCIEAIADFVEPRSVEGRAFLDLFQEIEPALFVEPEFVELTSSVFWP